ncbi:MAG: hypothetical protein H6538_05035 [Bacteroidales bacterium]|nr:hypothetical protein [Bacteroidales bacterium]MCB8998858.1 hypothetical protein [Bacteroidales bacterium]MCB9014003.1 hypothetical protein [Bacteroidales bacterium]
MKNNFFENRNVGIILTSLAILLLFLGTYLGFKNHSLNKKLNESKIKTESLFSENLSLEKSTEKLKADLKTLQKQNADFKSSLASLDSKIKAKESEIAKLKSQNANAATLSKKIKELEQLKLQQEAQIKSLNLNNNELSEKNSQLSKLLDEMQKKNEELSMSNQILIAMEGNNYRSEALKKNEDKNTVRSTFAKKLSVKLDVPADAVQNIRFKVKSPSGKEFSSATEKNLEVITSKTSKASSMKINEVAIPMSSLELVYTPEKKLEKGVYVFDIYNKDQYSGSTQVKLR